MRTQRVTGSDDGSFWSRNQKCKFWPLSNDTNPEHWLQFVSHVNPGRSLIKKSEAHSPKERYKCAPRHPSDKYEFNFMESSKEM